MPEMSASVTYVREFAALFLIWPDSHAEASGSHRDEKIRSRKQIARIIEKLFPDSIYQMGQTFFGKATFWSYFERALSSGLFYEHIPVLLLKYLER